MRKVENTLRTSAVIVGELLTWGTIIFLIKSGDGERLFLAFGTMLFVLVPELIERLFNCRINTAVYLIAVLYAVGPMLGHCWKFYYTVPCWDRLLHICGGVMFAILGVYLFEWLTRDRANYASAVVFALCFSIAISVLWEFAEYGADKFFGMDMQDDTLVSGITSYLLGSEKGVTGSIGNIMTVTVNGAPLPVDGYIDIGLHDTMMDMLLESTGALVTGIIILLDKGRHPLMKACARTDTYLHGAEPDLG